MESLCRDFDTSDSTVNELSAVSPFTEAEVQLFSIWLTVTCPPTAPSLCCVSCSSHARPHSGCVYAYMRVREKELVMAGVRVGHGGWLVIRDQRGHRHASRCLEAKGQRPICPVYGTSACVCLCACHPSALVTGRSCPMWRQPIIS